MPKLAALFHLFMLVCGKLESSGHDPSDCCRSGIAEGEQLFHPRQCRPDLVYNPLHFLRIKMLAVRTRLADARREWEVFNLLILLCLIQCSLPILHDEKLSVPVRNPGFHIFKSCLPQREEVGILARSASLTGPQTRERTMSSLPSLQLSMPSPFG